MLNDASILITGGTGSFGKKAVETILSRYNPRRLIIFSRDELKQFEMSQVYSDTEYPCIRYFIGDVRDQERLQNAFRDVDFVIHAAALKQVPAAEYNPFEAIKTNVLGAQNVIRAALEKNVKRVVALSTDKAANPVNLYGATKLCSDKLFAAGAAMSGKIKTKFCVVRYGNVFGSRGSVVPFFLKKKKEGVLPITHENMTRFSITLQDGVDFVLNCLDRMEGGEVFVPKLPSYRIMDVAQAIAPDARTEIVGIRPGEKLHEVMVPADEAHNTLEYPDHFVIKPSFLWDKDAEKRWEMISRKADPCPENFSYDSGTNTEWLTVDDLRILVEDYIREYGMD